MAGNHPWPGDPMQSFKVLLHHRRPAGPAACWSACSGPIPRRSIARSPSPRCGGSPRRAPWGAGRFAGCCRSPSGSSRPRARRRRSCSAGHASWSSTAPCLSTPRRFTSGSARVWARSASSPIKPRSGRPPPTALDRQADRHQPRPLRVRVFPQGGLTYVTYDDAIVPADSISTLRPVLAFAGAAPSAEPRGEP